MKTYLITGGAGFVGSNLATRLKRDNADAHVIALDNLKRRGSELNVSRLKAHGVEFVHGDVRVKEDMHVAKRIDCILDCSAEPSVLAGYIGSPEYVVNANLVGMLNCLELARQHGSDFIFLSSSRVYSFQTINALRVTEMATRYELVDQQSVPGVSSAGLTEEFPLDGSRSLYGATKLAGELMLKEYLEMYGLRGVINRCSVLTGPWQMGKIDQGVVVFWVARHILGGPLSYIGYGGNGKQVRDILHIDDLYRLLDIQLRHLGELNGQVFNVGGGRAISVSLLELTALCEEATGSRIHIERLPEARQADVRVYLSDCRKVSGQTGWTPVIRPTEIIIDIAAWIRDNRVQVQQVLA